MNKLTKNKYQAFNDEKSISYLKKMQLIRLYIFYNSKINAIHRKLYHEIVKNSLFIEYLIISHIKYGLY